MEWMNYKETFLPLMVIRRYLKLVYKWCDQNGFLDKKIEELQNLELPFKLDLIPTSFPNPMELSLNIVP